ncbi:hypothetical protein [Dyadobacter sediminis]|uniref:Outer membrane protein beta-barrel domain-containing protein n=1 Tax=Dyadobacter sediminis TaxID=1493691 RepID=A0A5R9KDM8_9BACT|nr:hypothetical protein [Dyadobacter sediminis]TLU94167.1 hypothetical protein FEM55_07870 [Dyadobacter sediminis]GGB93638.1 hypothetical protein GCM10011325_21320 [Dyadobacter sediminis]
MNNFNRFFLFLSALFLLTRLSGLAQDTRSFFSVTGGYSLPVGELAREKLNDPLAGLAGSGYFGQVNYDFRIARWLGLRASGSMNINKTNSAPIIEKANSYAQVLGESFTWQNNVSTWKLNAAMIGPALYLNMNRVQIEVHAQVGKVWAKSPSVKMTGLSESGGEPIDVSLRSASTSAYGLAGGGSLRFPLAGKLFFQISGDVIGAQAEIRNLSIRAVRGNFDLSDKISEKRFIGVVNAGAGFGIAF